MTQLRCTLFALLGLTLAACSDDKTVVAVNYSYGDGIEGMESVHVLITQGGQKFETTFETPLVPGTVTTTLADGGMDTMAVEVPDDAFFQRYELDGFTDGEATLKVELLSPSGSVLYTEETTFDVRENGAVAAYAEFEIDPPAEETSGSTSDTAAASSAAATDAGSDSGAPATSAPDAASSTSPDAATTATDSGTAAEAGTTGASDAATSAASDASSTDGG